MKLSLVEVLLEGSQLGVLVGSGLEATMTLLGGGVDKLEVDLLGETLAGQSNQGLNKNGWVN